ncbi:anthrax toxin-like adenylyl cyclase domain-containing protein [Temperatibacter marinus]|uniref:Anthrax toxin-like adenylyl cyclase domain-containing protein n=1 Tax=Temperatibacter marinus TaxID=1456591 RepID=A0AA52H9K5_9PROT|nr:anthrax toxin-like adenylyl cyclase domain-containing protein [Temperatibacter marinus]WND03291.1 anthrax toxin-like adenylyl cyclase domain-containing protein [Temperatibacter marinus]
MHLLGRVAFLYICASLMFIFAAVTVTAQDAPPNTADTDIDRRVESLKTKHKNLKSDVDSVLKRLIVERTKVLADMQRQTREAMAEWENDPNYLNGKGLKAALFNAEAVAEGYGFDVNKLRQLYTLSKEMILGLEMVNKCGVGSPQLDAIGKSVDTVSKTAKGAMEAFGLAANEEERLACVQTEKLNLYREVNRAYIYALTADSAKDAAIGFRRFAGYIQDQSGRDADRLVQNAEQMAEDQDTVMILFEMTPVIGELIDLYRLGTGNDILGEKMNEFDRALTGVLLFTPAIAEQLFKRYPQVFHGMNDFLRETMYPQGGFFDSLIIRSGQELAVIKDKAREIWAYIEPIGTGLGSRVGTRVRTVAGESVEAINRRMQNMSTYSWTRARAIEESNIIPEHMTAMMNVAESQQIVIMLRPFNKMGKQAMQEAVDLAKVSGDWIATKWMDVKPKSAANPILGAGIPVDPSLSKFDVEMSKAIESGSAEAIASVQAKITKMETTMAELFAMRDAKGNPLVGRMVATHKETRGNVVINHQILWATEPSGKKVMGILDDAGDLIDPATGLKYDVDVTTARAVEILTDPHGTKILPDYDTFAVGSKSISGDGVRTASGELIDETTVSVTGLGNIDRRNLDAMTDINNEIIRTTGVKGDLVHHGAANAWIEPPDYPITVIMPGNKVISIPEGPASNRAMWIQEEFHRQTQLGNKGFIPHPSWGWPEYDPRFGYKTQAEKAVMGGGQ